MGATKLLTVIETAKLENLEEVIAGGLQSFVDVGRALMQIRDEKLYRKDHDTFEDYCKQRWSFGRNYVNKIIAASDVVSNLGTVVPKPENEAQARPLARLPEVERTLAWKEAVQSAPNGKVTAKHVEAAVERRLGPEHLPEHLNNPATWKRSHAYDEAAEKAESSKRDAPRNGEIKTDVDRLIEGIEKLIEKVNAMAANRMGHNNHSRIVVATLKQAIGEVKTMGRSWRNK